MALNRSPHFPTSPTCYRRNHNAEDSASKQATTNGLHCRVLEYLAISQEASYMGFAVGRNAVPSNDYQGMHMYSLVGSIWRDMYRLPMPEIKATSWTKASESLSGPRFPVEMQIAIDLALWVPFGPNGWKSGMKWHDAHPGWRFLTIVDSSLVDVGQAKSFR